MSTPPKEPTAITVGGNTYQVSLLPAWQCLELTPLVGKLVAPSLGALAKLASEGDKAGAGELESLGDALVKTLAAVTPAELRMLSARVLTGCLVTLENGQTVPLMPIFDTHFQGKPFAMLRLIGTAVAANFGDFTDGLRALGARLGSPAKVSAIPLKTNGPERSGPPGA